MGCLKPIYNWGGRTSDLVLILLKPFETAVLYPTRQIAFDTKPMAMSVFDNSSFNVFTSHIK